VELTDYSCQGFGPYGGAVDSEGNFWMIQNNNQLAVVYRDDLSHKVWNKSPNAAPYGLTVDSKGRAWVTSYSQTVGAARFDPMTETWAEITDAVLINNGQSGIAQGGDGRIWMGVSSGGTGIASIDAETLEVLDVHQVANVSGKGISVDGHGYVWRAGGSTATRIDPDDGSSDQYVGLTSAYTYSDMTGFGVANASGCTPAG
jgi:streptogramin lyase